VPIQHNRTNLLLTVEYNHSLSCLYLDSYIFWSMTIINTKSQSKVKYSGCIFTLQCTMSSQYSLKYTLYEIVKISKKLVTDWQVVNFQRCIWIKIKILGIRQLSNYTWWHNPLTLHCYQNDISTCRTPGENNAFQDKGRHMTHINYFHIIPRTLHLRCQLCILSHTFYLYKL
jgi:hypothetical protein